MTLHAAHIALATVALGLAGCAAATEPVTRADLAAAGPRYLGIDTRLLDGDLVAFTVGVEGARTSDAAINYAECAAARYALIRGYGFARHVRTTVAIEDKRWLAEAVYVISDALPDGIKTIDAEVTVASCHENGIPTI